MNKRQARLVTKEKLASITTEKLENGAKKLQETIQTHPMFKKNNCILLYSAIQKEIPTNKLIESCLLLDKQVYLPKVLSDSKMEFYQVHSIDELKIGSFQVKEPKTTKEYKNQECLMVVPMLACFKNYRLGYGKGFYDRYLKNKKNIYTIGVALKIQELALLEVDEYDIPLSEIILFE